MSVPFDDDLVHYDPEGERQLRADNDERERKLWGDLLPAKRVLQRRGFGVWWHNKRKRLIHVGDQVLSIKQFKRMAALHKRLSGIK